MYTPAKPYKRQIIEEIRSTWKTPYVAVTFNTYPVIRKKISFREVDHTDGIGTKGVYHWRAGTLKAAVTDALAMNLNDLALVRAIPYKLSNHITVPKEDSRMMTIVREMAQQCRKRKIAIVGGENSFHDNMEGLDISMTVSGFIKKPRPNRFRTGDVLIGLKSSGLHSNGFTAVRRVFGKTLRREFTVPTAIYLDTVLTLCDSYDVRGMMHITGGAYTKLRDILGSCDAYIAHGKKTQPHAIFQELHRKGVSGKRMYETFNCGIGFILSAPEKDARAIVSKTAGADIIGRVTKGSGHVHIQSAFDDKEVHL